MDSQTIEATAARWLVKRASAAWAPADQQELDAWLHESTLHRVAFIRLESVWQRMARLKALGAGVPAGVVPAPDHWNLGGKGVNSPAAEESARPRRRWYGLAAALVVACVAGYWLYLQGHGTRYATPIGGLETLTLGDGSQVTLNTNTSLRVHLEQRRRQVELDSGEAYFVVAKDPSRPFVVRVGNEKVSAVGTEFAVRHDSAAVQIVVTDGRVQLSSGKILAAGEIAQINSPNIRVTHASDSELGQLLHWREGFVVFNDTPLSAAVAEFNRYHTRQIRITDPAIASIRISGKFRTGNAEAFLWLLQQGFPVTVEQQTQEILLHHRS